MPILVLNAGSSSLKSSLFATVESTVETTPLWQAQVDFAYQPDQALIQVRRQGGPWEPFPALSSPSGISGLALFF